MKGSGMTGRIPSKFKSIQSSIFCAVSILVLSAVLVVTLVSLRYTNSSIYENSVMYTQTIIKQLNQNIDSYISYMDNIASVIAGAEMPINICTERMYMVPQRTRITVLTGSAWWSSLRPS